MKKALTFLFFFIFLVAKSDGQYVDLPDSSFRDYLRSFYPGCFNAVGQMDTTCTGIINCDSFDIQGPLTYDRLQSIYYYPPNTDITNTAGLRYFKNLHKLFINSFSLLNIPDLPESLVSFRVSSSPLQNISYLPNSLKHFNVHWGLLTSLPTLPEGLKSLHISYIHSLVSMPLLPSTLDTFIFSDMLLTSLTQLPSGLRYIEFNRDSLKSLPILPDSLTYLNCNECLALDSLPILPEKLRELYVSSHVGWNTGSLSYIPNLPGELREFWCQGNISLQSIPPLPSKLTRLVLTNTRLQALPPLPDSLETLSVWGNQLTAIPTLPNKLKNLYVSWNQLTQLPVLNDSLISLDCRGNLLTQLPSLPEGIMYLDCSENRITALASWPISLADVNIKNNEIYCLPKIPTRSDVYPIILWFDGDKISCIPNIPSRYFELHSTLNYYATLPICNPTNNINHCQSNPTISGNAFFDNNNNGIKDASEPYKPNLKINLSNGSFTYTNNNGYFEIGADSLGSYTVAPTVPNFYNIIPASATYNFTSYDTIVSKDYALQANTIKDSLAIKLTAINWAARPGFSFAYSVQYENAGTTTLSPNIVFEYDNTKLQYDSSSNGIVVNNGNNLSLSAGSIIPGQQQNFTVYFKVKPTTAIGDSIVSKATASTNAVSASDSSKVYVRGSFDPNDKQATKQLDPQQVYNGAYIDYTIRFQNTGTDTAFNVVISDTLAPELLLNTLEVTAASHTCKTSIKDNVIFFEFLNILLPDSNVNEAKSHGFVSFKIKPHPSVPSGSYINNKAAIYFDYNVPVITNTATTFIKNFGVIPVKLISFSAVPQNDITTALYWNTANEINCKQFVIERGNDGLRFNAITSIAAKGMVSNSYTATVADNNTGIVFYRLKMIDNDGRFTYSPIIKIDRRKNAAGFSVQTNPVKDMLVISTTDLALNNTQASIINMQGAVVKTFVVKENVQTIDIKTLAPGIYYIRSINGSQKILVN